MNYIKNYSITFNASSLEFQSTPSVGRATNGSTFEPPLFHDFNPRPPWGGRRFTTLAKTWDLSFQSTPSVGRATIDCDDGAVWLKNFNPRPPWGGRLRTCPLLPCPRATFQSTPSVGRATIALTGSIQTRKYISIHALRGEGDLPKTRTSAPTIPFQSTPSVGRATLSPCKIPCRTSISIHALRGEGDARRSYHGNDNYNFNPRPPWGGRLLGFFMRTRLKIFQSTPSVGRATKRKQPNQSSTDISIHALRGEGDCPDWQHTDPQIYFNPRPPWGGRQDSSSGSELNIFISIHALRGEGDAKAEAHSVEVPVFQSTPSVGRATFAVFNLCHFGGYFNPRPPWGGRPYFTELIDESSSFQSTPSVGRATKEKARIASAINRISIHALRGEGDRTRYITDTVIENFNPRPPWGGRLLQS